MTVTITDENHIPEILKQLEELGKYKVSAGIPAGHYSPKPYGEENFADVGTIAAVMEYGATILPRPDNPHQTLSFEINGQRVFAKSVTIPSRPFIRTSFTQKQGEWTKLAEQLVWQVAEGDLTAYKAYDQLGIRMETDIKKVMSSGEFAPNKRGGTPLINTGHLRAAVTHKVEEV